MITKESALHTHLPFPDPPERRPEDMSTFNHLTITAMYTSSPSIWANRKQP